MRKTLWSDLFFETLHMVNHDDDYARNFRWCSERFPALRLLEAFSELEIILLAWIICSIEWKPEQQHLSFADLEEALDDFHRPYSDIQSALDRLIRRGWVNMYLKEDGQLYYAAHRARLEKDGLFIYNPWHHLSEMGLYVDLCDN